MRELKVIGLEPDGKHLVCADAETGQKFRLPADDKLRAASRGDIARFGQIEIEMDSTLRPKDIQARIRAGASVEQVAAKSGMPASRVERFAYPVLLERSRAADLAQKAHPVLSNGPAVQTLSEVVTLAFRTRGHNIDKALWDAWKDEDGHWVAQLRWQAGRTSNTAHWRFQPDAHGGTVTALDDPAKDLIDPDFGRALRGLTPVPSEPVAEPVAAVADQHILDDVAAEPVRAEVNGHPGSVEAPQPKKAPGQASTKDKRGKPAMPSWEDVLLGVRSSGH